MESGWDERFFLPLFGGLRFMRSASNKAAQGSSTLAETSGKQIKPRKRTMLRAGDRRVRAETRCHDDFLNQ
jgi:hypothetical protein